MILNSIIKDYYEAITSSGDDRLKGYDKTDLNSNRNKTERKRRIKYF